MPVYVKAMKVGKLMYICAIIYYYLYFFSFKVNILWFGLICFAEYKYKYIWVDQKRPIQKRIYLGWKKRPNANTNILGLTKKMVNTITNMNRQTGICKYKYK